MHFTTDAPGVKITVGRDELRRILRHPVTFYPLFGRIAGSAKAGLMLSQAYRWDGEAADTDGWFVKPQAEWEVETTLTNEEQLTARRQLIRRGLIETERRGVPGRIYFRLLHDEILRAIGEETQSGDGGAHNPSSGGGE